jgi:hypothetical protein
MSHTNMAEAAVIPVEFGETAEALCSPFTAHHDKNIWRPGRTGRSGYLHYARLTKRANDGR